MLKDVKEVEPEFVLIVEDFSLRDGVSNSALVGPKVIGVIEQWAWENGHDLIFQRPDQAFFFFKDSVLKERGLLDKKHDHAMAALKHLLFYRREFV